MVIISLSVTLFIFIFLSIFQPFGISKITEYKFLIILGYALITGLVLSIAFYFQKSIFPVYFDFENWTLKKSLIVFGVEFFFITIFNSIYTILIGAKYIEAQKSFLEFFLVTVSVGSIPALFLLIFIERFLTVKHQHQADVISEKILKNKEHLKIKKESITIGKNSDSITIDLQNLLIIKAEGNYLNIFYLKNKLLKKEMIRCSLSKIMNEFSSFENIKHCHRSYIVNFDHIISVTGNARNYGLEIAFVNFNIPVSRSFSREIILQAKSTQ